MTAGVPTLCTPRVDGTLRTTSTGLLIRPDVSFDSWLALGRALSDISKGTAWCLGDWLIYGQSAFENRYRAAIAATSLDYQTLRNYAWVARQFDRSRRRPNLSFQHHATVAGLSQAEQDLWLSRAERLSWSRTELRRRLAIHRHGGGKDAPTPLVSLQVRVAADRERRWRRAAASSGSPLLDWLCAAADAAADESSVLPPVRP